MTDHRKDAPPLVVLPMLTLVPGGMGGSETYALALAQELSSRDDVDLLVLVSRAGKGLTPKETEVVAERVVGSGSTAGRIASALRALTPGSSVRAAMGAASVVHYPLSVPLPLRPRRTPLVVTLHDVQHLDMPENFSAPERAWRRATYDFPARRADLVITVSEFCRERIIERLNIAPDRVRVSALGVRDDLHAEVGLREPFVLYPARSWPHKNHEQLLAAMHLVRQQRPDLRLVLTGGASELLGPLPRWVEHRGLVPETELHGLYRRASCLVFPSLYEGFGLPPLEAMASGCPVAVSSAGALPEVCGEAAVLFDARDPRSISEGILAAVEADTRRVQRGLARAAELSWAATAQSHVDVYRELVSRE